MDLGEDGSVGKPPEHVIEAYRQKIREWEALGFDVEGLEDLLIQDFEAFREVEQRILTGDYRRVKEPLESEGEGPVLLDIPEEEEALAEMDEGGEGGEIEGEEKGEEVVEVGEGEGEEVVIRPKRPKKVRKKVKTTAVGGARKPAKKVPKKASKARAKTTAKKRPVPKGGEVRGERYVKGAIGVILAAIIILSVYTVYPQPIDNILRTLFPKSDVDVEWYFPPTAPSGTIVVFDATNSTGDIDNYTWAFKAPSGALEYAYGKKVYHHFGASGEYGVKLTVHSSQGRKEKSGSITILPLTVTVPERRINDFALYDIHGYVNVTNPNGLYSGTLPSQFGGGEFTVNEVDVAYETKDSATVNIWSTKPQEDGFGAIHTTLPTETKADLDLTFTIKPSEGLPIYLNGELNSEETTYEDLKNGRAIQSKVLSHLSIDNPMSPSAPAVSLEEAATFYPLLRKPAVELSVSSLRENRTFSEGEEFGVGGYDIGVPYGWQVVGADNINGFRCLKLLIKPDPNLLSDAGIESMIMYMWLSSQASLPVKTYIRFSAIYGDNVTEGLYVSEMLSFTQGTEDVDWGACSFTPPSDNANGHYYSTKPNADIKEWIHEFPEDGLGTHRPPYTLEEGVSMGKENIPTLNVFLKEHPGAYVVHANLTQRMNGSYLWTVVYGDKALDKGFVFKINSENNVEGAEESDIDAPLYSLQDTNRTLTIASAPEIFQDEGMSQAFADGRLDYMNATLTFSVVSTPSGMDITSSISSLLTLSMTAQSPEATYTLTYMPSQSTTLTSTLDAATGQCLSVVSVKTTSTGGGFQPPF